MTQTHRVFVISLIALAVFFVFSLQAETTNRIIIDIGGGIDLSCGRDINNPLCFCGNFNLNAELLFMAKHGYMGIEYNYACAPLFSESGSWKEIQQNYNKYELSYSSHIIRLEVMGRGLFPVDENDDIFVLPGQYLVYRQDSFSQIGDKSSLNYKIQQLGFGFKCRFEKKISEHFYLGITGNIEWLFPKLTHSIDNWDPYNDKVALSPMLASFVAGIKLGISYYPF